MALAAEQHLHASVCALTARALQFSCPRLVSSCAAPPRCSLSLPMHTAHSLSLPLHSMVTRDLDHLDTDAFLTYLPTLVNGIMGFFIVEDALLRKVDYKEGLLSPSQVSVMVYIQLRL
jgi:hypothetical protein